MMTCNFIPGLLSGPTTRVLLGAIKSSPNDDATQRINVEKYIIVSTNLGYASGMAILSSYVRKNTYK